MDKGPERNRSPEGIVGVAGSSLGHFDGKDGIWDWVDKKWNIVGKVISSPLWPPRYLLSLNSSPQFMTVCHKYTLGLLFLIPVGDRKINHPTIITFF